jgi:biopolymer transport protein ExbD
MLRTLPFLLAAFVATAPSLTAQITVSFPASASSKPLDGRVLLLLSTDPAQEPRMQIDDSPRSQIVFGTTVDSLAPDQAVTITNDAAGYPIRSLSQVPAGDYNVQAVLNVYQTFHRADGTTVKLAPDRGEGQRWNLAPGNLYSKPVKVHIDDQAKLAIQLTEAIPPIPPVADTKYIAEQILGHADVSLGHCAGA